MQPLTWGRQRLLICSCCSHTGDLLGRAAQRGNHRCWYCQSAIERAIDQRRWAYHRYTANETDKTWFRELSQLLFDQYLKLRALDVIPEIRSFG